MVAVGVQVVVVWLGVVPEKSGTDPGRCGNFAFFSSADPRFLLLFSMSEVFRGIAVVSARFHQ